MEQGRVTAWVGWVWFAAALLFTVGVFGVIAGLVAVFNPNTVVAATGEGVAIIDVSTWGWVHLVIGVLVALTGLALFGGAAWARLVAIVLIVLNMLVQFVALPSTPWWSITAIILSLVVLWALVVHGGEARGET
ncbi:hypothetical protein ACGIF2_11470 [Cellulomonas sp. P22]|uniref:DUF7144 family membrane protein n=1 Tax=Cellulomonas sp. P22 TaxID=3373189 RepID=UPI0037AEB662